MDGNVISWKKTDPATERALWAYQTWGGFHRTGTLEETQVVIEKLRRKMPGLVFPVSCYIDLGPELHAGGCEDWG